VGLQHAMARRNDFELYMFVLARHETKSFGISEGNDFVFSAKNESGFRT
jgi:hypothetical protein